MASFESVNYSLRPSKSIQRQLIFEGISQIKARIGLDGMMYVGFGSIWFTDFVMAHKILNIRDMVSIEENLVGYRRAVFNAPYATVAVRRGRSAAILPKLLGNRRLRRHPWVVWLDFDIELREAIVDDIRTVIEDVPENSIFLITFDGKAKKYGQAKDRPGRLKEILGEVVPDDLGKEACEESQIQDTLANLVNNFMKSVAAPVRLGRFVSGFRVIYEDTTPMVTVGGMIANNGHAGTLTALMDSAEWRCRPKERVMAPHLTMREAMTLQSTLPRSTGLTRAHVRSLNFDLEKAQIKSFEKYYREYPAFAQIVA